MKLSKDQKIEAINQHLNKTGRCLKSNVTVKYLDEFIEKENLDCEKLLEEREIEYRKQYEIQTKMAEVRERIRLEKLKENQDKIDSLTFLQKKMVIDHYNNLQKIKKEKFEEEINNQMELLRKKGCKVERTENGFVSNGIICDFQSIGYEPYDTDRQLYPYMEYVEKVLSKKIKPIIKIKSHEVSD